LLSESTGLDLPGSLLYENPTVSLLSTYLEEEIAKHQVAFRRESGDEATPSVERHANEVAGDAGNEAAPPAAAVNGLSMA
jgi:hypothetical protein